MRLSKYKIILLLYLIQVSETQMKRILNYIDIGVKEGATVACGGKRWGTKGFYVEPTVFINVTDDMTIAKEEVMC